ncbi:MAG: hypothetical protein WBH40_07495, partial [Ignavibacteriaceae bacterium]
MFIYHKGLKMNLSALTSKFSLIVVTFFTFYSICFPQNILKNSSFEITGSKEKVTDWNLIEDWNSLDNNSGIENNEFYSPVEGDWYAYQKGGGEYIYQETNHTITAGETYTFNIWARSINPPGVTAIITVEIRLYSDSNTINSVEANINVPQLKGAASTIPNDDGANVWIDGEYRHQFADVHMYQSLDDDPIEDSWLLVKDSDYEKLEGLGWAVGTIIVKDQK